MTAKEIGTIATNVAIVAGAFTLVGIGKIRIEEAVGIVVVLLVPSAAPGLLRPCPGRARAPRRRVDVPLPAAR